MPDLVRFLGLHALIGFSIAIALVIALIVMDIGGLRGLAMASVSGPMTVGSLALVLGLTFASVQMGFAVMLLGRGAKHDGGLRDTTAKPVSVEPVQPVTQK